ncbi:argininosuccinate lyase, partial [Candidatus Bipolaricaulota bacterium]|nr:argininosuccinate lyase [Candidatus Bipolaricaulota bacterium]
MTAGTKLWGGRFATAIDSRMRVLNDSFPYDRRLALVDVRGSIAYAGSLFDVGLLTSSEHAEIVAGLEKVAKEFASATFEPALDDEDIHTAVERRLTELIG